MPWAAYDRMRSHPCQNEMNRAQVVVFEVSALARLGLDLEVPAGAPRAAAPSVHHPRTRSRRDPRTRRAAAGACHASRARQGDDRRRPPPGCLGHRLRSGGSAPGFGLGGGHPRQARHQGALRIEQLEACSAQTTFPTSPRQLRWSIARATRPSSWPVDTTKVRFRSRSRAPSSSATSSSRCRSTVPADSRARGTSGIALCESIDSSDPSALIGLPLIRFERLAAPSRASELPLGRVSARKGRPRFPSAEHSSRRTAPSGQELCERHCYRQMGSSMPRLDRCSSGGLPRRPSEHVTGSSARITLTQTERYARAATVGNRGVLPGAHTPSVAGLRACRPWAWRAGSHPAPRRDRRAAGCTHVKGNAFRSRPIERDRLSVQWKVALQALDPQRGVALAIPVLVIVAQQRGAPRIRRAPDLMRAAGRDIHLHGASPRSRRTAPA